LLLLFIAFLFCGFFLNIIVKNPSIDFSDSLVINVPPSVFRIATVPGSSDPNQDEWPMFHGELNHTGEAHTTTTIGRCPFWSYTTGDALWSSPAVANGRVFVGSLDHKVYCLNATTGKQLWNYTTGLGVLSSPAVADGHLFVGSDDHKVYCLNATTGGLHWSYTTGDFVDSSPAVVGGRVYVGSWDCKIYCLNATNGMHLWNYTTGDFVYSSPAVVGGRVYIGSYDNKVYCLNATTGGHLWNYTTGASVYSSPALAGGRVYVGSSDSKIYCLNATTGVHLWHYTTGIPIISSPAVAGGRVYVGCDSKKIYCLNATTGKQLWNFTVNVGFSSIAVGGGYIYVGSSNHMILCLNASTGTHLWNFQTGGEVASSPAVATGCVYVSCMDHKVYCLPNILDYVPPTYVSVIESADPLELGNTETITIAGVADLSKIQTMLIAFDGSNHTMTNLGGGTWHYNNWTPDSLSTNSYTIYLQDNASNWNKVSGSIYVVDTTPPTYTNVTESADPLVQETETITIAGVSDLSGIQTVQIAFEGSNHTMTNLGGGTWQYNWTPSSLYGNPYTIYIQDNVGLWNMTSGSFWVVDTISPTYSSMTANTSSLELGEAVLISITGVHDISGIIEVQLDFERAPGEWDFVLMTNMSGGTYQYIWRPLASGNLSYYILFWDTHFVGNQTPSATIHVVDTIPPIYTSVDGFDPIELGHFFDLRIRGAYDLSGIQTVQIALEGSNHTMNYLGGDWYLPGGYFPISTGNYTYTIYIYDKKGNWNLTGGLLQVFYPEGPTYTAIIESADPLELGGTETITITGIADRYGVWPVLIEFEGSNHTMTFWSYGNWSYDAWTPSNTGIYNYTIYLRDGTDLWTVIHGSIQVNPRSNFTLYLIIIIVAAIAAGVVTFLFILKRRAKPRKPDKQKSPEKTTFFLFFYSFSKI